MKGARLGFSIATLLLLVSGLGFTVLPSHAATTSASLNNVQIFVQTTNTNMTSYTLTAYNSSGYEVVSSSSNYPGFGLELPSGTYLITVTASQSGTYYYPIAYASETATASLPANSSSIITPVPIKEPITEYGYTLQTINGPSTLSVKTVPFTNVGVTKIQVSVTYVNGTGVPGALVEASVIGGNYYDGLNSNTVLSNQTVSGDSTTLVVPNLPILLQGYLSLPINIPETTTTTTTTIGGQPVNITMFWEPNYVELTGSALIIPPQTSAHMTLQVEQSDYVVEPEASNGLASTTASGVSSSAPSQTGSNSTTPTQIPSFAAEAKQGGVTVSTSSSSTSMISPLFAALITITIVLVVVAGVTAFRFRKTSRLQAQQL